MKNFLIKVTGFFVLVLLIVNGLGRLVPYYWGDSRLVTKMHTFQADPNRYNTVFIGSSHVYRHIDPAEFDRVTHHRTRSFNLGVPGMNSLEMYTFYEHFLQDKLSSNIDYVIMELLPVATIDDQNVHTRRGKYYLNFSTYLFAMKYFRNKTNLTREQRQDIINNYSIAYAENILKIGLIKDSLMFKLSPQTSDRDILGGEQNGFYAIDTHLNELGEDKELEERRNFLRQHPEMLKERLGQAKMAYQRYQKSSANFAHIRKIRRLITESQQKGITLIFCLQPLLGEQYDEVLPVFMQIDEAHSINLSEPSEFSDFYSLDNCFDQGHLNAKGAQLLTQRLGQKFYQLQSTKGTKN